MNTILRNVTGGVARLFKLSRAFTLAEVLITLGIIGVVAAITIPTLLSNVQRKRLQTQFKKTYAEVNVAARTFFAEEDMSVHDFDGDAYGSNTVGGGTRSDLVLQRFMSYFKGQTRTSEYIWRIYDANHKITQKNLNGKTTTSYPCDESSVILDITGRIWAMDDTSTYSGTSYGPKICVDINGVDSPNRLGYDRFVFVFTEDNSVVPYTGTTWNNLNANQTDENVIKKYCDFNDSSIPAFSCAYFALKDKNPNGGSYWKNFLK